MRVIKIGFSGNKANRVKEIAEIVKKGKYKRVVEVFGGSCVISNNLLKEKIVEEAIANDYDHYFDHFEDNINFKKGIVEKLLKLGFEKSKNKPLNLEQQKIVHEMIRGKEQNSLKYLAKNFVFSSKRASTNIKIEDFVYFMNDLTTEKDIEYIEHLKNVKLDNLDYKEFIEKYIKAEDKETIVIIDPPYLNSAQKQYNDEFFGLEKTIKLLNTLEKKKNDFIFFNQVKEDSKELLKLYGFEFDYSAKITTIACGAKREDFMAHIKFNEVNNYE